MSEPQPMLAQLLMDAERLLTDCQQNRLRRYDPAQLLTVVRVMGSQ